MKQRTEKTPFESERHTKTFWVRIGSAKALQTFPGYASFFAAYMKGGIDGQEEDRDFLNRPIAGTGAPMKTDLADDIGAHDG